MIWQKLWRWYLIAWSGENTKIIDNELRMSGDIENLRKEISAIASLGLDPLGEWVHMLSRECDGGEVCKTWVRNSQTVFVGKWKEPARDTLQLSLENVLLQRPTHQYLSNLNSLLSDSRNPHGLHEGELKSFLMRVKEESEKADLTQHLKN